MPHVFCHPLQAITWVESTLIPVGPPTVYAIQISRYVAYLPQLNAWLLPDERSRAERYHHLPDRQRFVVARGLLRLLLGRYTGLLPAAVRFGSGPQKKPVLPDFPALHFNVAHAGDWVLIAIGPDPLGVDVEQVRADFAFTDLLPTSFSPEERTFIGQQATSRLRFYELWTRKEALVKATGKGIDDDFHRVPSLSGNHLVTTDLIGSAGDWAVGSFMLADGYIAAVAYVGTRNSPTPLYCEYTDWPTR